MARCSSTRRLLYNVIKWPWRRIRTCIACTWKRSSIFHFCSPLEQLEECIRGKDAVWEVGIVGLDLSCLLFCFFDNIRHNHRWLCVRTNRRVVLHVCIQNVKRGGMGKMRMNTRVLYKRSCSVCTVRSEFSNRHTLSGIRVVGDGRKRFSFAKLNIWR